MKQTLFPALFAAVLLWALTGFAPLQAHDPISARVTWTGDIAPLFQAHCVGCHHAGSVDPMPLATYEQAQPWASAIRQQVLTRQMPVWHAARGFGEFVNDPSLSPFDLALIAAWANAGAPRGDANEGGAVSDAKPPSPSPIPDARQTRTVTLACGRQPLSGQLLAVAPRLEQQGSATITALLPTGQREIIAWIRSYDPRYQTTYWLRAPLTLPRGSRLEIAPTGGECRLIATLAR